MEDFEKMIERVMQSLGDRTVLSIKVVENQIDTVESGGIGIQNNHYHGVQPPHFAGSQPGYNGNGQPANYGNGPFVPDGNGQHPHDGASASSPDGNGQSPYPAVGQLLHSAGGQPQIWAAVGQSLAKAQQVREEFAPRFSSQERLESEVSINPESPMNQKARMDLISRTMQPGATNWQQTEIQSKQTDGQQDGNQPKPAGWQQVNEGIEEVSSDEESEFVVPSHIPPVLNTEKAWELWKRAKAKGWVDRYLQPTLTDYQATILANVMAGLLDLKVRWSPFEQLWGIKNLATKWFRTQATNYYSDLYHEIEKGLSS